jgi:hypothetical protein
MKNLLLLLFVFLLSGEIFSQLTTTNPDTVCYQTQNLSQYTVTSIGAGNYNWTVPACATITSGQGTNTIFVNWSNCPPGLITNGVSVVYTSQAGCPSPPVNLNVLIFQVVPTITPIGPFCVTDPCIALVGTPVGGVWSGNGVVGNQFCPQTAGPGASTITYTYSQGGCTFTATTNTGVSPQPTLTPIQHN